jgi:hypothetical protein
MNKRKRLISFACAVVGALSLLGVPAQHITAAPDVPLDVPDTLVASGVTDYTVAAPKVWWRSRVCTPRPPSLASVTNAPSPDAVAPTPDTAFLTEATPLTLSPQSGDALTNIESINRIAIQGSTVRAIYSNSADGYCDVLVNTAKSNLVADNDHVYWVTNQGLVRLSTNANPGDAPQILNGGLTTYATAELAIDNDFVYVLTLNSSYVGSLYRVAKSNGVTTFLRFAGSYPYGLQVSHAYAFGIPSYSGDYVYWIDGGVLRRHNLNTGVLDNVASGVKAFYAEGGRFDCDLINCINTDRVFLSTGRYLLSANNRNLGTVSTLYDTGSENDPIYSIVTGGDNVFFLQGHFVPCSPSPCFGGSYNDYVVRRERGNTGPTDFLYSSATSFYGYPDRHLTTASGLLVWQSGNTLFRLPNNAAALPKTDMRITGMLITQGIQRPDNSVTLIRDRRTFVRVFVKSDGPSVPGVTMHLHKVDNTNFSQGYLLPVNNVGTNITVRNAPNRAAINDAFVFELPFGWLESGLRLRAELNPYHIPLQNSYANNSSNIGPFNFVNSPRLQVQFISWMFARNNVTYAPRLTKDIVQTYSWIRRAYPLASTPGFWGDPSPGFRPNLWINWDDSMATYVDQSNTACNDLLWKDKNNVQHDDRNLCASRFSNQQMVSMRTENGLPSSQFFYGMIPDWLPNNMGGTWFPRGQACCGEAVSTGPAGSGTQGWDFDGSYADWYAAHEIGHTLGRGHPKPAGDPNPSDSTSVGCGHSQDDAGYPWANAEIGANNDTEGFDAGDPEFGIQRAIYPGTVWHDVMSYCNNQWVSDYTYLGMLNFMNSKVALNANANAYSPTSNANIRVDGDFLTVQGTIYPDSDLASINRLRRVSSVANIPAIVPGGYAIELLNTSNGVLASYGFTPQSNEDAGGLMSINQIVDFVAGARAVRIVRTSDNTVLTTLSISPNAPVLTNVALQGAPEPVTGTVTLGWDASDADGDALTFDVFYSRDAGATFQPVRMSVRGNSTEIDTLRLGGGTGVFRVVANDGANTAQADSAPFSMEVKPPQPHIVTPNEGLHVQYGQLINFMGEAEDFQDGGVSSANLVWSNQKGVLGTGPMLSKSDLPVGQNIITLTATNSQGQSASTSVTVYVDDNLDLLGPTLTADPLQFGWSFNTSTDAPQSATLHIGNAGSGNLSWTAVLADAPWLTLSATSGTAPSVVTLTADPSGLAKYSQLSGTLTVTDGNGKTAVIPVGIAVGVSFTDQNGNTAPPPNGGGGGQRKVFIPMVSR